jgi:protein pelota
MQIIKTDFKKGTAQLRVDDPDDLWYLSHIIEPGDFIKGKATRKVKIGDSENAKVAKKTYTLKIEAETIDFNENILRINGKIKEGPEDLPRDSYQAISLEIKSECLIEKVQWLEYQKQKLKEASEKKFSYLILLFDREEALFAITQKFGYTILLKLKGEVKKKNQEVTIKNDFYTELIKTIEVYNDRHSPEAIVIASPAFYKEDLFKKINNPELKKKIVLAVCSSFSEAALDEVLKRPELEKTLQNSRAREEQILMDELLEEISKNNLAVYGWKEVEKAIQAGAIKNLLITENFIKEQKEKKKYHLLDTQMKSVDAIQGKINLLSSKLESGKKLDGLGGIAALLRYKLEW